MATGGRRSSGRGGRGRGRNKRSQGGNTRSREQTQRKGLGDYIFQANKGNDFETISKYLINHIKQKYTSGDDIGTALETGVEFEPATVRPKQLESVATTADDQKIENDAFKMIFKEEVSLWVKRKNAYQENLTKAAAFLIAQCAKTLRQQIEARSDYVADLKTNPIELLKAIKEEVHNYRETKYDMDVITQSLKSLVNLKQYDQESISDYTHRFKVARDIFVSKMGNPLLIGKICHDHNKWSDLTDVDMMRAATEEEVENNKIVARRLMVCHCRSAGFCCC